MNFYIYTTNLMLMIFLKFFYLFSIGAISNEPNFLSTSEKAFKKELKLKIKINLKRDPAQTTEMAA